MTGPFLGGRNKAMLKYTEIALSHREVPNEAALCIYISGCLNRCADCHYPELQRPDYGELLSVHYTDIIDLYLCQATCVCFLGEGSCEAEEKEELRRYAAYAAGKGLRTCLYSGRDVDIEPWMHAFDYVKVGSYKPAFGPLDSPSTNQRMFRKESDTFRDITSLCRL